jgi:hypothetical protein
MEVDAKLLKDVIVNLLLDFKRFDQEWQAHSLLFKMLDHAYPKEHLQQKFAEFLQFPIHAKPDAGSVRRAKGETSRRI